MDSMLNLDMASLTLATKGEVAEATDTKHAREKVLGTVELLEAILLHLSMQDLFHIKRMYKFWRVTLHTSPALRSALRFQKAGHSTKENPKVTPETKKPAKKFASITILGDTPKGFELVNPLVVLHKNGASTTDQAGHTYNPLLAKFISSRYGEGHEDPAFEEYDKNFDYDMTDQVFRLGSTWRMMQVAQPPLKSLIVRPIACDGATAFAEQYGGELFWDTCYDGVVVKDASGVKFRDLFRVLQMIMMKHKEVLKWHRDDGRLVEHLEGDDEDTDHLKFHLLVKTDGTVDESSESSDEA